MLSRRWLLFGVFVAVLAYGCWWLGGWQFDRLAEREADNARTERNLDLPPADVDAVLAVDTPVDPTDEWRRVRATGIYLDDKTVVVRYQTRDGGSGIDAVTPLRVAGDGALLLVNRGWLQTDNAGQTDVDVPAAPAGTVTVTGWVRADATGPSTSVSDASTRAVSSVAIGPTLDGPVYGGFVELASEQPEPAEPLERADLPDLGEGPHFFYGLQWWFFAALAIFGFGYLAWDERRKLRRGEDTSQATSRPRRDPESQAAAGQGADPASAPPPDPGAEGDGPGDDRPQAERENWVS
jgi:cytochrome oxidase assembly protein ShyY1